MNGERPGLWFGLKPAEVGLMLLGSAAVLATAYGPAQAISISEAWGFVTGGICVWLVVREHVGNWPVGMANNVYFFLLFFQSRLYADMALQIVYFGLGIYGWLNWIFGGEKRTQLAISRTAPAEWIALAIAIPVGTWGLCAFLQEVKDAAPFWDSLTTVLSLAAQYLLCRKRFENWFFWIAADVIYVPLYLDRGLRLTAVLYAVFLGMCFTGLHQWRQRLKLNPAP
jgi:nicotinamide mononucleotide transporter